MIEKFDISVTEEGLLIRGEEGMSVHFSAVEALMLLDILKAEETTLRGFFVRRLLVHHFDIHPAVLGTAFPGAVVGDGLSFAPAHSADAFDLNPFADQIRLDRFVHSGPLGELFAELLPPGRAGVSWADLIEVLVIGRLCEPSSELHVAEKWYRTTALEDLFGIDEENGGRLTLIDEALTPDSSRYWDRAGYEAGRLESFDKQVVRDWLDQAGWDHEPPAPPLPPDVVARTQERYLEVVRRLGGEVA